ncbi:hypothetical protein GCM10029978_107900 [Actinoallomurus acanthiterrae]
MTASTTDIRRQIRFTVWGLASTFASFACTFAPWQRYAADRTDAANGWQLAPLDAEARLVLGGVLITCVLAVIATAEARGVLAFATGAAACVTELLAAHYHHKLSTPIDRPHYGFNVGFNLMMIVLAAHIVVFFAIARSHSRRALSARREATSITDRLRSR